jgi:hypothetical protein
MTEKRVELPKRLRATQAAILNFFLWGSGYLYMGRRKILGLCLMGAVLLSLVGVALLSTGHGGNLVLFLAGCVWGLAGLGLAVDAYAEAMREERGEEKDA